MRIAIAIYPCHCFLNCPLSLNQDSRGHFNGVDDYEYIPAPTGGTIGKNLRSRGEKPEMEQFDWLGVME